MNWLKHRGWERKMDAELQFHLDTQIAGYIEQGMSRKEAEKRARIEFGPLELAKDECRDQRPTQWLSHIALDVRYAARSFRQNPGFAAAVIATLALGIGANTAVFSVVHAVLLKPLPYANPEQIHSVEVIIPKQEASLPVTIAVYQAWRQAQTTFTGMAVLKPAVFNLTGDGEPERLGGARVSANFFSFLGAPLAMGRGFTATEEQPGNENVVVISHSLWRSRYAADPAMVGRKINLNNRDHTVVGIAPPSLLVPTQSQLHASLAFAPRIDVWKPIAPTKRELESENWDHGMLVRLPPDASPALGRQQLEAVLNRFIRTQAPGFNLDLKTQLIPIREIYSGNVRLRLLLILAASGLLLLTACSNITNLFLARTASRANEFATRVALGAGRMRILSQVLTETMLLAIFGGALGIAIAVYGASLLITHGPADVKSLGDSGMNLPVLLFAIAASLLAGLASAVFPGLQVFRTSLASGVGKASRMTAGGRTTRVRQVIIGVQMALATALLASAGLLLHSFLKLKDVDRGYQIERVLAVDLALSGPRQDPAGFYRQLAGNIRALPGVLAAGAINDLPVTAGVSGASQRIFHPTDSNFQEVAMQRPVAMIRSVTEGYFAASGASLRAGRFLTDQEPAPVALISESLAERLWPKETAASPVGRTIRQGDVTGPLITIVGVVGDVRPGAADRELPPFIYRPFSQWTSGTATLVLRTAQDPTGLAPAVRAEIRKLNPNLPIPAIRTMREILSASIAERRFQMMLTSLFAVIALLLGAVGVFGVVSYTVGSQTREIGLRLALGAMRGDVLRQVMVRGMIPAIAGLAAGLAAAVSIATMLRGLLFGIAPSDPIALGAVVLALVLTSGLACYFPARRASRLDPIAALRCE